jgi:hypothetical protein
MYLETTIKYSADWKNWQRFFFGVNGFNWLSNFTVWSSSLALRPCQITNSFGMSEWRHTT